MVRERSRLSGGLIAASLLWPCAAHAQLAESRTEWRGPIAAGDVLVDEVTAAVQLEGDERPPVFVLASEYALSSRLAEADAAAASVPAGGHEAAPEPRLVLQQLIGEHLLEREAARATDPPPTAEQLEDEREYWNDRLAPRGGVDLICRAAGADRAAFDAWIARRVIVRLYLERHLASAIEPSEAAMRTAYDEERIEPFRAQGVTYALALPEIRDALIREQYPHAVRSYLRSIGTRAQIRLWSGGSEGAAP